MSSSLKILRRYRYDPLDRLSSAESLEGISTQRFYQSDHLVTEREEFSHRTIIRHEAQPLAQQQSMSGVTDTKLLATDLAHSLLRTAEQQVAYTAYGHHPAESGLSRLIGFNGECPDPTTGHYPLGQGTRTFNPVLMRFNSPDELSPFGKGGINAYAYCEGDPINFSDPTGNVRFRPWNFPTSHQSSKITGLDLSSNTGFSANGPVSSPIASIPSAKVPDEQSIFSLLPAEHEPIRSKTRVEKRAKQNDLSLTSIRKRRRLARKFDDLVRNEPSFRSSAKPLLNDYVTAAKSAEIEIKADPKKIHNIGMRLQHKRQITKRNILIELGHEAAVIRGRPPKN